MVNRVVSACIQCHSVKITEKIATFKPVILRSKGYVKEATTTTETTAYNFNSSCAAGKSSSAQGGTTTRENVADAEAVVDIGRHHICDICQYAAEWLCAR